MWFRFAITGSRKEISIGFKLCLTKMEIGLFVETGQHILLGSARVGNIYYLCCCSQRDLEEPDDVTKGRDVFNQKPYSDEFMVVSDIRKPVTTSLPQNIYAACEVQFAYTLCVMLMIKKNLKAIYVKQEPALNLPADKAVTRRNAMGVIGAELRNDPNPTIRPCGIAACLAAAARLTLFNYYGIHDGGITLSDDDVRFAEFIEANIGDMEVVADEDLPIIFQIEHMSLNA
ncbi:peptidyl-prolyl cis-trans isomerase CYP71 [Artemisia annua]|uniref:Peptidyl-prolyl cis-trans isomerase CYP71 n=1 Tax=Artemisia annua TaxID=35608 RepID=A0A2U1PQP6_ARTAN|nr:peptidyl-prolyl cis-trans isomerase CYP71 [Artemisia annua]